GIVITNAELKKPALCKIAGMAQDGYARTISPVHTSADGHSIYAVAAGTVAEEAKAAQGLVGTPPAEVMSEATTRRAARADSAYGYGIYAASAGNIAENVKAHQELVVTVAAEVMSEAIRRAVTGVESAYGFMSCKEFYAKQSG